MKSPFFNRPFFNSNHVLALDRRKFRSAKLDVIYLYDALTFSSIDTIFLQFMLTLENLTDFNIY